MLRPFGCTPTSLPSVTTLFIALASSVANADEHLALNELDDYLGDMPVVLSATRLAQPLSESPASISVIDRELIAASGARSIPDLLRLVPGFQVGVPRAGAPVATHHGFGDEFQRRLQVLVDGRSVYVPLYGGVPWGSLPLTLEDIERIEVVRGPNASVFGPNAFSAVINITTRHAAEEPGIYLSAEHGGNDFDKFVLRGGLQEGQLDLRITAEGRDHKGYKTAPDDTQIGILSGRLDYSLSARDSFSLQAGLSDGDYTVGDKDSDTDLPRPKGVDNYYAQAKWERHYTANDALSIQLYHNSFKWDDEAHYRLPALGTVGSLITNRIGQARQQTSSATTRQQLTDALTALDNQDLPLTLGLLQQAAASSAAAGDPVEVLALINTAGQLLLTVPTLLTQPDAHLLEVPISGSARSERTEIEIQRNRQINADLRTVYGASLRYDRVSSPGFLGANSPADNHVYRLFAHTEWRFAEDFLLNAGAMLENNDITGSDTSPRLALLYRQDPNSVWRFSYSRATRTPVIFEARADSVIPITFPALLQPAIGGSSLNYVVRATSQELQPETIDAVEIGYNIHDPARRARLDFRLYREEIDHLVDSADLSNYPADEFNQNTDTYTNRRGVKINGLEIEASIDPRPDTTLRASYAYANGWDAERDLPSLPQDTLSLMVIYRPTPRATLSAEYYYVSDMEWMDASEAFSMERLDLRAAHRVKLPSADVEISVQIEDLFARSSDYFKENQRDPALYVRLAVQLY